MEKLVITVKEIRGTCPVYRIGDKIVLDEGYKFNFKETHNVCMHSLASILPYHIALYQGIDPRDIGLSQEAGKAYVQCLDPCDYTGGGTVIFQIEKTSDS
ncbi:MAG: TIGR04076 family protein [Deltaproteobacteria bacterium]|nr:MAG: TIGR04076 family protein [Deltaproteobacteria bacterium]